MTDYVQVVTTTPDKSMAETLARALVQERLAACVQIVGPLASTFWWEGRLDTAQEWQLVAKTRADLFDRVCAAIRAGHSYQVPEIVQLPITGGLPEYLAWMDKELQPRGASDLPGAAPAS